METFRRLWNKMRWLMWGFSAFKKGIIIYMAIILVPASVFLYSYYQKTSFILEEEVSQGMLQTLKQAGINLNFQFDSIKDVSNSIFMNPNLHKHLNTANDQDSIGKQLEVVNELRYLVDSAETNKNVFRVRLFVDETKIFASENINFFDRDGLLERSWYNQVLIAHGGLIWTNEHLETYINEENDLYVFTAARVLHDPNHFDTISGFLLIDMVEESVSAILEQIEFSHPNDIYLVDPQGTIVSHPDKSLIATSISSTELKRKLVDEESGIVKILHENEAKYVIFTTLYSTGWKLVAEVPKAEISRQMGTLNPFSGMAVLLGISVLFLLLVFVILAFLIQSMNRRIQQVTRTIQKEGIDRLDDNIISGKGEYNLLELSVDRLIHRVKNLMEETYRVKVLEREAQLRALQAQINPHFLYNTLDTINWIAIGRNAHDISHMIDSLSKYFRLSLNKGRDVVSIEDELNLAQVYLEIQQNRFPGSFEFHINFDHSLKAYVLPKLTLQPIVENALLHGIRKSKGKRGVIKVDACLNRDDLVLKVTDDGIGMDAEFAASLLIHSRPQVKFDGSGSSYGMFNVNERIKLFAGEAYGLTICSKLGEGTTVTVTLKAIKEAPFPLD